MNNEIKTKQQWKVNKIKYVNQYQKENYKQFKVTIEKEIIEELESILKSKNITKADFVRESIKRLKEETKRDIN